ncbi:hypothetical protein [Candidatus Burkholderia verschuerenii]|uniref:hypothetical protein n=1 Tax=Candidatus Burkholderia verschuerenii TaxID=242163 RepID=UPI0018DEB2A0|nr:hypothetical protein [Candidatus Burkholderia verschuerenii]
MRGVEEHPANVAAIAAAVAIAASLRPAMATPERKPKSPVRFNTNIPMLPVLVFFAFSPRA